MKGLPLIILIIFLSGAPVWANVAQIMEAQLDALGPEAISALFADIEADIQPYLPAFSPHALVEQNQMGGVDFNLPLLINGLVSYLFKEVRANLGLLGQLLVLAALASFLSHLRLASSDDTVANLAFSACYLTLLCLAFRSFAVALTVGQEMLNTTVSFMQSLLPLLSVMLVAAGGVTSAQIIHPLVMTTVVGLSTIIRNVILPLLLWAVVLGVVDQLVAGLSLKRLAKLFLQSTVVLIGLVFTIFLGVMVIKGIAAPLADSVALRSTKFMLGSLIPVLGKMLVDTVEVVSGCANVLRSSLGLLGVIGIFGYCLFPAMKLVALVLLYRFVGAVVQPLGDERLSTGLDWFSDGLFVLFLLVLSVGLMLFVGLAVLIGAANPILI